MKSIVIALFYMVNHCFGLTDREIIERYEGKIIKGNRNALFLVNNGVRRQFPDFHTYISMGYVASNVTKIHSDHLDSIRIGEAIPKIAAPPPFRPDDYAYHEFCEDFKHISNDLGVVPSMGNFDRFRSVFHRVNKKKKVDILALGGSITAGGYFEEFVRLLRQDSGFDVVVHNHGHGATDLIYTIFCVDIDRYKPDLVLIDFSVNDNGHPKLMDALLRKVLIMESAPLVVLVNMWVHVKCPVTRYLLHSFYYQLPLINICPVVNVCFGRARMPKWITDQYSETDGVHPWGSKGVHFIGNVLYAWWRRYQELIVESSGVGIFRSDRLTEDSLAMLGTLRSGDEDEPSLLTLPPPLYPVNSIGSCTRCDALVDDADSILTPVGTPVGFKVVTRVKIGFGGFNPADKNSSNKSFKRSWQADTPGSTISFRFFGSSIKVSFY